MWIHTGWVNHPQINRKSSGFKWLEISRKIHKKSSEKELIVSFYFCSLATLLFNSRDKIKQIKTSLSFCISIFQKGAVLPVACVNPKGTKTHRRWFFWNVTNDILRWSSLRKALEFVLSHFKIIDLGRVICLTTPRSTIWNTQPKVVCCFSQLQKMP